MNNQYLLFNILFLKVIASYIMYSFQARTSDSSSNKIVIENSGNSNGNTVAQHKLAVQQRICSMLMLPLDTKLSYSTKSSPNNCVAAASIVKNNKNCDGADSDNIQKQTETKIPANSSSGSGSSDNNTIVQHSIHLTTINNVGLTDDNNTNMGHVLLKKLGWHQGVALGKHGGVAAAPLAAHIQQERLGIGCCSSYKGSNNSTIISSSGNNSVITTQFEEEPELLANSEKLRAYKRTRQRYYQS